MSGELRPPVKFVPAGPPWALIEQLLRGLGAKPLSRLLGYTVNRKQRTARVRIASAEKVQRFHAAILARRNDEPMPDGWQTSARPVTPMGAEEWARGGWSVERRTSKKAKAREEVELKQLARKRRACG